MASPCRPVPAPASAAVPTPPSWHSETDLVCAAADGRTDAGEQLVAMFQPLIASVARTYRNNAQVDRSELMQAGALGLLRALKRYDASRGTPFWGYASWWVRQSMQEVVAELTRPVVLSDRALRRLARIKQARTAYLRACGREPTVAQITATCDLTREQVEQLLATERPPKGFEEPLGRDGNPGATFGESIADPSGEDAYETVPDRVHVDGLRERLDLLADRERKVLYEHYGLGVKARTLREIAAELSLSVERVRQIEERALTSLRAAFD